MDLGPLFVVGTVAVAGLVRGITGFGGAMVMTPALSVLIGPTQAVVVALVLETSAAIQLLPDALRKAQWKTLLPISVAACLTIPLGSYLLITLDKAVVQRVIAGVVIIFSAIMMTGVRYAGERRIATSAGLGLVSGVLLGSTSIGAPPVILYLLSGPDPAAITRANLIVFLTIISAMGLAVLLASGIMTADLSLRALVLVPLYLVAIWIGGKVFAKLNDAAFRRFTLLFMLVMSVVIITL